MIKFRLFIVSILILAIYLPLSAQVFVEWDSQWHYHKGLSEPSQPGTLWLTETFDLSGWPQGNAPFRYGDGNGGTVLDDMQYNYSTLFIRREFTVEDLDMVDELRISVDYDDGFVLWINGEISLQRNAPQNLAYNEFAPNNHESGEYEVYTITRDDVSLVNGTNIIAIQGFNVSLTSSDFFIDTHIEGIKRLPETDRVTSNTSSGFYNQPFTATLSGTQPGDTIRYTLDGSDPRYSDTSIQAISPVDIAIYPGSTLGGRGETGGVVLRASKFAAGFDPGKPVTRTFIFINDVIAQTAPGGNWPSGNVNGQVLDYPMDTRITSDPRYSDLMDDALLDIPTISLTTDPYHLFNAQTGIYVNAKYRGREWERPVNMELINPDGSPGFNIDAGIRIRGGWSRHPEFAKHAFRFFFRSEYGEGKLNFPLFGSEGADEFDKIDLRTSQNYSWSKGGSEGKHNTMNRDVFSRETQRDMDQPYSRSRYYHVYINGLYWGVFQTQERSEARYAETYFGGNREDYDVIKVDVGDDWNIYEIEATDGNTDAWQEIWNKTQQGFSSNTNYFALQGMNPAGVADSTLKVMVDIDNLIDYMLIIFYGGNFDSPVSKFSNNQNPNNFFAIYDRTQTRQGFRFIIHDAEHTLLTDAVNPGVGLDENRVNIGNIEWGQMNVTRFEKFHPQWLHHRLTENPEYRLRFADRVYRHFYQNGVFHPDSSEARFMETANELQLAIIAESARWGDMGVSNPRNKLDDWVPAVNRVINDYFPYRTDIVKDQLLDENLYISLQPPIIKKDGAVAAQTTIPIAQEITIIMENPNPNGTVYYTINGNDPRVAGGAFSGNANVIAGNTASIDVAPGTIIKARTLYQSIWSPLHEVYFQDTGLFNSLKITELHYHPADVDTIDGIDLEFIELKNTGFTTLDLSGIAFTDGIEMTFPEGSILEPQQFVVIASNDTVFTSFYGLTPSYAYSGQLSNGGEKVVLETADGEEIISFTYSDEYPWPLEADGDGYSLVSMVINPTGDPDTYQYWMLSKNINGSPFADDPSSTITSLPATEMQKDGFHIQLFPNPARNEVQINFTTEETEKIEIGLYNLDGRLVNQLVDKYLPGGTYQEVIQLDGMNITPGLYLVVARSNSFVNTRKLIYQPQ